MGAGIGPPSPEDPPIILLHTEGQTDQQIAELIAAAMEAELGLTVEVRPLGLRDFVEAVRNGEGDIYRLGWTSEHPMPSSFLDPLFHTRGLGQDNVTGFSDPEVDSLLDQANRTADRVTRLVLEREAEARLSELMPIAPILSYRLQRVVAPDVQGFRMDVLGRIDLARVALVPAP